MNVELMIATGVTLGFIYLVARLHRSFAQKRQHYIERTKQNDLLLETMESLSYCLSLKLWTLWEVLSEVSKAFFRQKTFTALWFILPAGNDSENTKIWRFYNDDSQQTSSVTTRAEEMLLEKARETVDDPRQATSLSLDEIGITDHAFAWKSAVVANLAYQNHTYGHVIFLSELNLSPTKEEHDFLTAVKNIFTLLVERADVDARIPLAEQIKAVNIPW